MTSPFSVVVIGCLVAVAVDCHASFEEFRWTNRLILVDGRGPAGPAFARGLARVGEDALRERKLQVFALGEDGVIELGASGRSRPGSISEREIMRVLGGSDIALVGLDGGGKARYSLSGFKWAELFSSIDAMPMRRAELRRKKIGL